MTYALIGRWLASPRSFNLFTRAATSAIAFLK